MMNCKALKKGEKVKALTRRISCLMMCCLVACGLVFVSGCVADDDESKAVTQFQTASDALTQAYQTLMTSANLVETNEYIDQQVSRPEDPNFVPQKIDAKEFKKRAIYTDDQIKARTSAIKALTDYTTALASLAAGKPAAQVQTDATTASTSLKTLTNDAAAMAPPTAKGAKMPDFGTPIGAAVNVIGNVLELILKHRGEKAVRDSVAKHDAELTPLYKAISDEAGDLYARQKSALSEMGPILNADYDKTLGLPSPHPEELLALSDRIKQHQKDMAALAASDPSKATAAFQKAHEALVKTLLAPKNQKKLTVAELIAAVKSFVTDVTPLVQNSQALAKAL